MDVKARVEEMLTLRPKCRDNDKLLTAYVWHIELEEKAQDFETVQDFLAYYAYGDLTSADTITRARRYLQEHNSHLRGKEYASRQNKEKIVRENVNHLFE